MSTGLKMHKPDYKTRDDYYWEQLEVLMKSEGMTVKDILMMWPTYVRRREMPRFLAHYELFKQIIDVPGCIIELGVYKGASFFTWTKLMETFCPGDRHRKIYGFDHFEGLMEFHEKDGKHVPVYFDKQPGGWKSSAHHARVMTHLANEDLYTPHINRCELIEGDLKETLPKFLEDNPGMRIALLHLDVDLYIPTRFALEHLYPLVVKGGIVCFDEYGLPPWQGETVAMEEYFQSIGEQPALKKFPTALLPNGYFVK